METTFTAEASTPAAEGNACQTSAVGTQQAVVGAERLVTANETWTLAGSPHRGGVIRVHDGAVLTIEAGATVCVEALYMENGGRLVALGQAGAHVVFTLADPSNRWGGLFFNPPRAGTTSLAGPSILRFVDIENPSFFFMGPLHPVQIHDSRVSRLVSNTETGYCPSWYLTFSDGPGGSSLVERVVVERFGGPSCAQPAVRIVGADALTPVESAFSFGARVLGSGGDGVHVSSSRAGNISFGSCEIYGSAGDGLVWLGGRPVSVSGCNITGNTGVGMRNRASIGQLMARSNWWGDAAGPDGPAGDGVAGDVDAAVPLAAPVSLRY